MRNALSHAPLPLLTMLFLACSGSPDPDLLPAQDEEAEFAFSSTDAAAVDKGRPHPGGSDGGSHRRHGRHHHGGGGGQPPAPPAGQSCEAAGQTFPDGSGVPSGDSCNSCGCNDGSVICTLALCEPVFCALFVEEPDGVCSRFPLDPCISQDPDCLPDVPDAGSCEAAGQTFPDGSDVPSGDPCNTCGCNDGNLTCTLALCDPVFCALFVEDWGSAGPRPS
jgi:hypothetical protein